MAGSPSLFNAEPPGVRPPDGTYRRWTVERGWIDAEEAVGFAMKGFEDCLLYTAKRLFEGAVMVYAYEGRAGTTISAPKHFRNLAIDDAKATLRRVGRPAFDAAVEAVLREREANRG